MRPPGRAALMAGATSALLLSCGDEPAGLRPPEIEYGEEVCDHCSMILSDARFATAMAVRTARGDTAYRSFDDVGALFLYARSHPDLRVLARWVHDYGTGSWLPAEDAVYVQSSEIASPMAHGVAAFATRDRAEELAAGVEGQVMDYAGLADLARSGAFEQGRMRGR